MDLSAVIGSPWPCDLATVPDRHVGHYVYVLRAMDNTVLYIGETRDLRTRLKRHARNKKFAHWSAYRMRDRWQALDFEARLIDKFPPLLFESGRMREGGEWPDERYAPSRPGPLSGIAVRS